MRASQICFWKHFIIIIIVIIIIIIITILCLSQYFTCYDWDFS